jgi:hypothetical protein|tara:strand:- start:2208 stop:2546 length:339 start_codon:yes stop_codon:yes gene_type:complete
MKQITKPPKQTNNLLNSLPSTTTKLSANFKYISSVEVEIKRNLLNMITTIDLVVKPVEVRISEKLISVCPHQFDTIEELLSLINNKLNKLNNDWKNETIFLRSQLNLFEENQ